MAMVVECDATGSPILSLATRGWAKERQLQYVRNARREAGTDAVQDVYSVGVYGEPAGGEECGYLTWRFYKTHRLSHTALRPQGRATGVGWCDQKGLIQQFQGRWSELEIATPLARLSNGNTLP